MTGPAHETPHAGIIAHVKAWFARDVAPDLADLKITAEKVREMAPHLKVIADLAVTLAKASPGLPPQAVQDAVKAAEVVARIAAELAASGM